MNDEAFRDRLAASMNRHKHILDRLKGRSMMDEATRLGELIHDSLINHTGSARTMGSFRVAEDVLAAGYVKLDGIDVEVLRRQVKWADDGGLKGSFVDLARQVLAALDGRTDNV